MTIEHILYIPTIFLLGFLFGKLTSSAPKTDGETQSSNKRSIPAGFLVVSFLMFAFVFVATHFFELPASSKAVTQALGGLKLFDTKPSFSADEVYSRISQFSETGIHLYKRFTHTIDIVFPLSLLTFLILLGKFVSQNVSTSRTLIVIVGALPIIWFGFDLVENGIVYYLLNDFPVRHNLAASLLGYITISKFTFLFLSVAAPAFIDGIPKTTSRSAFEKVLD
jgi:hypothetical protein